jgi:hypothetical protein
MRVIVRPLAPRQACDALTQFAQDLGLYECSDCADEACATRPHEVEEQSDLFGPC